MEKHRLMPVRLGSEGVSCAPVFAVNHDLVIFYRFQDRSIAFAAGGTRAAMLEVARKYRSIGMTSSSSGATQQPQYRSQMRYRLKPCKFENGSETILQCVLMDLLNSCMYKSVLGSAL